VWRFAVNHGGDGPSDKVVDREVDDPVLERALHKAIKKVTEAVAQLRFNTAIAEMMVFANEATKAAAIPRAWIDSFIAVLSPFAPHVSSEIWKVLGHSEGLAYAPWPAFDESKIAEETITIAVQVMGKTRSKIEVPADIDEAGAIAAAKADEKIARLIEGKTIRREIYVPGRLVNLVAN
jgi:leucyl-tRNA synthetase